MTKRMLIDTTHAEETRVVVMDDDRVEDYDVETSSKKQLKGNIYLAKVIRVEPSLQAAFVEYGGNRHGFLAFSEIHPDYFQIPIADREKLLALQEEELATEQTSEAADVAPAEGSEASEDADDEERRSPETVGGEHDTGEENAASRRTARFLRNYKIQEVIRRRQVVLVQVVKEERGNKGAALTTYISLAGRYCVLMPNALRGGGVSRKITSDTDRRRLRDIITGLDLPRSMAMIVRTAGAGRPGPEVVRDCEYLLQLWDDIRSHALSSVAPALVYEEASLIKRAIRDLFSKDIEDITIDGEPAWRSAREFMRLLMPHNANKVKLWQNRGQSLFSRFNVESHLDAMFSPTAQLRSGGYLVINQTEALVAIDVNSGKSTSQRNIEETALRTNLEAAEEVARQLRLRDLAGLVVIDFIDMESRRHNAQVEKRLKDSLRSDRARIQVGHISHFGLLEMSRQRLRPSISEAMLTPCPHCQGTGFVRGTESAALHVLRALDEEGARQRASEIEVFVGPGIALYILNNKRNWLYDIEQRHRMQIFFETDEALPHSEFRIERLRPQTAAPAPVSAPVAASVKTPETVRTIEIIEDAAPAPETAVVVRGNEPVEQTQNEDSGNGGRRRRRRRGGRRNRDNHDHDEATQSDRTAPVVAEPVETATAETQDDEASAANLIPGRRRTRFRRAARDTDEVIASDAETANDQPKPERQPEQQVERPTETKRSERDQRTRNPAPRENRHAEQNARHDRGANRQQQRDTAQPAVARAYSGPTPADPFGGSFDIFDIIEQAELNQVPASLKAAATAVRTEQVSTDIASEQSAVQEPAVAETAAPAPQAVDAPAEAEAATETETKPVRRGRGRPRKVKVGTESVDEAPPASASENTAEVSPEPETPAKQTRRPRRAAKATTDVVADAPEATEEAAAKKPRARRAAKPKAAEDEHVIQPINIDEAPPAERRSGWWKR